MVGENIRELGAVLPCCDEQTVENGSRAIEQGLCVSEGRHGRNPPLRLPRIAAFPSAERLRMITALRRHNKRRMRQLPCRLGNADARGGVGPIAGREAWTRLESSYAKWGHPRSGSASQ